MKLETADYFNPENPGVLIERKGSIDEIAKNLGLRLNSNLPNRKIKRFFVRTDIPRFLRCLDRLGEAPSPYLIVEANISDFYRSHRWVPDPILVLSTLNSHCQERGISLQLVGKSRRISADYVTRLLLSPCGGTSACGGKDE